MMLFSLPSYRRFAETSLQRLRRDGTEKTSDRLGEMLFNLVIAAALWGVLLYARWLVVSDLDRAKGSHETIEGVPETIEGVPETIEGKWRPTNGSHFTIAFMEDGKFVLSWKNTIVETAHYRFGEDNSNEILLSDFHEQPGDRAIARDKMCWFRVSLTGKKFSTTIAVFLDDEWRRTAKWHGHWQIEGESLALVPTVFERVK